MLAEFRLIMTGTFNAAADRDACYASLKTQIQTYNTNNPGKLKRADMTRDDYFIPDGNVVEKVV
jgi:hypothetical protein